MAESAIIPTYEFIGLEYPELADALRDLHRRYMARLPALEETTPIEEIWAKMEALGIAPVLSSFRGADLAYSELLSYLEVSHVEAIDDTAPTRE